MGCWSKHMIASHSLFFVLPKKIGTKKWFFSFCETYHQSFYSHAQYRYYTHVFFVPFRFTKSHGACQRHNRSLTKGNLGGKHEVVNTANMKKLGWRLWPLESQWNYPISSQIWCLWLDMVSTNKMHTIVTRN